MKKINRIIIKHLIDENADLSYLGEFSDRRKNQGKYTINHGQQPLGYKYFNADNVDNMKQAKQNYERMIDYNKGNWWMIGIKAEAEIETGNMNFRLLNTIKSSELWGVNSDCDDSEFKEIEDERLDELKDVLRKLGFSKLQIEKAPIKIED